MLLRRVSVLSVLVLSLGSVVGLTNPNPTLFTSQLMPKFESEQPQNRRDQGWMQELNLTQEQRQKLQDIRFQYHDRITLHQQALHQAIPELRALMAGDANSEQIRLQHQHVQQLRQELDELGFESMLAMREVLTPEQRRRFAQLMEQRREDLVERRQENSQGFEP